MLAALNSPPRLGEDLIEVSAAKETSVGYDCADLPRIANVFERISVQ